MANIKKFGGKSTKKEKSLPASMSEEAKAKFEELRAELAETGIDTVRYHRALVMMAKDLALEEMCEKDINQQGSVCYEPPSGASKLLKEHPSAKNLHTVRNRIFMYMKSMGMLPNTKDASAAEAKVSEFAALGQ